MAGGRFEEPPPVRNAYRQPRSGRMLERPCRGCRPEPPPSSAAYCWPGGCRFPAFWRSAWRLEGRLGPRAAALAWGSWRELRAPMAARVQPARPVARASATESPSSTSPMIDLRRTSRVAVRAPCMAAASATFRHRSWPRRSHSFSPASSRFFRRSSPLCALLPRSRARRRPGTPPTRQCFNPYRDASGPPAGSLFAFDPLDAPKVASPPDGWRRGSLVRVV